MAGLQLRRRLQREERAALAMVPEAWCRLLLARMLLLLPFARTAPGLGVKAEETAAETVAGQTPRIHRIARAIQMASRLTPWKSTCMVRAVAGMEMLERRGFESTLYMGVARDKAGQMVAHAWLRSGRYYVSGAEEMRGFVVVERFARYIQKSPNGVEVWKP